MNTQQHEERVKLPSSGTEILLSHTCCLYWQWSIR